MPATHGKPDRQSVRIERDSVLFHGLLLFHSLASNASTHDMFPCHNHIQEGRPVHWPTGVFMDGHVGNLANGVGFGELINSIQRETESEHLDSDAFRRLKLLKDPANRRNIMELN
jgi:hypothetical protein